MFDVIIVQKKTAQEIHHDTRQRLENQLNFLGLTYEILTLDDIQTQKISYFDPSEHNSGFRPKKLLVIALGGDGTLLHASHYVGSDVRLLGVNSSPQSSTGHLCALKPNDIETKLESFVHNAKNFKSVHRLSVSFVNSTGADTTQKSHVLPLCLNDILICHKHPAATARSVLTLTNTQTGQVEYSQLIFSSGIWISTAAGQTAAISSYGFEKVDEESNAVLVAIREPYFPRGAQHYESCFSFVSSERQLSILSRMRQGLVCVDGPDSCVEFGFDDSVLFNMPKEGMLRLIL